MMAAYLYCVVKSSRRPALTDVPPGLPGATLPEVHEAAASLWVVLSEVPLDVYGPAQLEPRLRDLDWVARIALSHEAVVEHFARARGAVVIPTKLFTMFSSVRKAVADVARRRTSIERVMTRIAGCEEWGIRVTRTPGTTTAAESGRPASGTEFLAARKAARDAAVTARRKAIGAAEEAYRRLALHARDARQRERRQEPGTNPPILEAAFLVESAVGARFKAEARRQVKACAAAGADLSLSGPWPAYNFIGTT